MAQVMMSALGLYRYDNSIFDGLLLPSALDRDTVIDNILTDTAEFEILYPDADFLKHAIMIWSAKQLPIWNALYDTTQYEYNPIWNKDGTITETYTTTTEQEGETETTSNITTESEDSALHEVYGFNSDTEAPASKDTSNSESSGTNTASGTTSSSGVVEHTSEKRETGNIGVTSTQSLILEQRNVVAYTVIDTIIDDFKRRFCILVY